MGERNITPSTKDQLLQVAIELMLSKGYTATSLDDICRNAGITKGGFFHYFKGKDELGKAAVEYFWRNQVLLIQGMPFNDIKDPLERLYGFLDSFVLLARNPDIPKSCLIGNFSQELSGTHPEIRSLCKEKFSIFVDMLACILEEAKVARDPSPDIDVRSLAEHFTAILQGALILAKAKQDPLVIEAGIEHFRRYLKSLFEKSNLKL